MSVLLLPRLTALGVSFILETVPATTLTPEVAKATLSGRSAMLSYAASGGSRDETLATKLGESLRTIASRCGYPANSSQVARAKFDHETAIYLASHFALACGEAMRDDVWSYMATVEVPDVVSWRFPDPAAHRFEGGVRNTLQRLWWRGTVLDRGEGHDDRWGLVRALSEDGAVQIFERASIMGNRALAIALAEQWVQMAGKIGRAGMEPVMRRATKLIRLKNEIVDLGGLPSAELSAAVAQCFELALESMEP